MRTTQFIGLTQRCKEQVLGLTRVQSTSWQTFGMFDEDIPLGLYYKNGELHAVEYVIANPWSSGPMIFTGLVTANGPSPYNWKESETLMDGEYNPEKGLYYV